MESTELREIQNCYVEKVEKETEVVMLGEPTIRTRTEHDKINLVESIKTEKNLQPGCT